MRIRTTKPEFWRSRDITSLPIADRFLFIGLWSYVDDNGVGRDELAAIIGDLFAEDMLRDSRETVARVSEGLSHLSEKGLICRYSVEGKPFLFVTNWEKHQRIDKPAKPRFPRPDGESEVDPSPFATDSRHSRDTPATGTGEQGNRGTVDTSPAVTESDFDEVWKFWPKKVERKRSLEQFKRVAKARGLAVISEEIQRFGEAYAATTERQFIPALCVWLSGERWTDDLPTPAGSNQGGRPQPPMPVAPRVGSPCAHRFVLGFCAECSVREEDAG